MFRGLFQKVTQLVTGRGVIDEELYDELEETLIESDVGVQTATRLVNGLREGVRRNRLSGAEEAKDWFKGEIQRILAPGNGEIRWSPQPPTLILVVGVNGTGKTTSIAKLTHFLTGQGHRVVLAAGDTFRAAAIDQLQVWADRLGVELVRHKEGADPAAVVFDAVQAARARGADVVIADTAGRLHTKSNLMEELKKLSRVAERALGRPADEVLLVLDATIGQNSVSQAKSFTETLPVTGIVLTKMDGTARGGVILSVVDELKIPIKFIGIGEKASDFGVFQPREFADALFGEGAFEAAPEPAAPEPAFAPVPAAVRAPAPVEAAPALEPVAEEAAPVEAPEEVPSAP
ncbi:MAG TPA: signal recognition particle-docking protein FtsY, partial [Armatimonadota bacterium]|nr:signal recognition particle-docking protein FtsY [Armatimonadota bacterium]